MSYLVDTSPVCTVVRCDRCPYWHAFTWTRGEGWAAAARHESIVHPAEFTARDALAQHRRRHPAS